MPGVDYTFLTVEEFNELRQSGDLLESGEFDGKDAAPPPHTYWNAPPPSPRVHMYTVAAPVGPTGPGDRYHRRFPRAHRPTV